MGAVDSDWGQIVTAYVVARAGQHVTLDMLRAPLRLETRPAQASPPVEIG